MSAYRFTNAFPYLLTRVGVRMGEVFAAELAKEGMTLQMYRVLAALWECEDQRLIDLADMVSAESSGLSRLIGTLSRMKYVTRTRLETNGRTVRIALTPLGRTVAERWIPRAVHYENSATQGFSAEEVADLKSKLERVFLNLKSASAEEDQVAEAEPPKVARRTRHPLRLRRARE